MSTITGIFFYILLFSFNYAGATLDRIKPKLQFVESFMRLEKAEQAVKREDFVGGLCFLEKIPSTGDNWVLARKKAFLVDIFRHLNRKEEAFHCATQAANQNDCSDAKIRGFYWLGRFCYDELESEKDDELALTYLLKSTKESLKANNHDYANFSWVIFDDMRQDEEVAAVIRSKAAVYAGECSYFEVNGKKKDRHDYSEMKCCYKEGKAYADACCKKDGNYNAISWEHALALFRLGTIYNEEKCYGKAVECFDVGALQTVHHEIQACCKLECANCKLQLAKNYFFDGHMDVEIIVILLEEVINQNDNPKARASALFFLGDLYVKEANDNKALNCLEKAAEQNDDREIKARAQFMVGMICYCGDGVERDITKAKSFLEEASKQGDDIDIQARALCELVTIEINQG